MPTTTVDRVRALFPVVTTSVEETIALGEQLAETCPAGTVLALYGDLGTGKTHLVKGIARGLGLSPATVRSPTFTILATYEDGDVPLYHFDAYRVQDPDEFVELGYEEYVFARGGGTTPGLTCIEWAERVEDLLPADTLHLQFEHVAPSKRRITLDSDDDAQHIDASHWDGTEG